MASTASRPAFRRKTKKSGFARGTDEPNEEQTSRTMSVESDASHRPLIGG